MSPATVVAALALATAVQAKPPSGTSPRRIASLNLCTDQLLLQLVDPARIAAVTHLAADAELSSQAARARGIPAGRATAEEVILLRPELALAGAYGAREAVEVLRRWGIPVLQIAPAESWEDIRDQLRRVAAAVREEDRADALIHRMDAALAALEARRPAVSLRAIVVEHDGVTFGRRTLADAVLRSAGFANVASELGIIGYGTVDLERLLAARPDLVVIAKYHAAVPTLGQMYLRHPALRGQSLERVEIPGAALFCGTTETIHAVERLVAWRDRAAPRGGK